VYLLKNVIPLKRSSRPVSSYLSVFGGRKEERLTASLGYLIAHAPKALGPLFCRSGESIRSVCIEHHEQTGRLDLVIECRSTLIVVEAKVDLNQNDKQVVRYINAIRKRTRGKYKTYRLVLLDTGSEPANPVLRTLAQKLSKPWNVHFVRWSEIAIACAKASRWKGLARADPFTSGLLQDFTNHLKEVGMLSSEHKEIYVKDISGPSLARYFKGRVYRCQPTFFKGASRTIYFAPYFTKRAPQDAMSQSIVDIEPGISYISRIQDCKHIEKKDVLDYLREHNWPDAKKLAKDICAVPHRTLTVLLLGKPYRLFMTPVTKKRLGIFGAVGQRFYTLEDLLAASKRQG